MKEIFLGNKYLFYNIKWLKIVNLYQISKLK